jgi:uncharacterized protein YndB with AHSA1/START domain
MTTDTDLRPFTTDPATDLVLERVVDVAPAAVWSAWTDPDQIVKWFTPAPWSTVAASIDLRPGGVFATTMRSPEGEEFPNAGCFLEVVEGRRLVFTSALGPDYRPVAVAEGDFPFTAVVDIIPEGDGTLYRATALHPDAAIRQQHEEMGFADGWGAALDQLVAMVKGG